VRHGRRQSDNRKDTQLDDAEVARILDRIGGGRLELSWQR
jgi:hypothetical protein